MKRKESTVAMEPPRLVESKNQENEAAPLQEEKLQEGRVFLLEDGKLKSFSPEEYSAATMYQVVECFSVECRLVRPEESGQLIIEGKKPSKKTLPIVVKRNNDCLLLDSWEALESRPEILADAEEVIGAVPVKQVFVLKRK